MANTKKKADDEIEVEETPKAKEVGAEIFYDLPSLVAHAKERAEQVMEQFPDPTHIVRTKWLELADKAQELHDLQVERGVA